MGPFLTAAFVRCPLRPCGKGIACRASPGAKAKRSLARGFGKGTGTTEKQVARGTGTKFKKYFFEGMDPHKLPMKMCSCSRIWLVSL